MTAPIFSCVVILVFWIPCIVSWSGNVCSRKEIRYYIVEDNYCSCWLWTWCSHRRIIIRSYYTDVNYCCPGWRHNGNEICNIAICSPPCQNGGTCVSPNKCSCASGFTGDICSGIAACSHFLPCYPGRCYGSNQCMCSENFFGPSCLTMQDNSYKPEIQKANATFAYYSYTKNEYAYDFMTDATNKTEIDYIWTNQKRFNQMKFDIDASIDSTYAFRHIPPRPSYIQNMKLGIVDARVEVAHIKLRTSGEYVANTETYICQGPSETSPISDRLFECRLSNLTNIIQIDSGDRYTLNFTVRTGGFRVLVNPDNPSVDYRRETYSTVYSWNVMEYRFDYDVPIHCIETNNTCTSADVPLELEKDITKEPIKSRWKGWSDRKLSGVRKYALEFWKMEYSKDYNGLREPDILADYNPVPQYIVDVSENDTIQYPQYEPTEPGVYSVILEVADRANNSRYVRRIAIFDKTSEVTINPTNRLFATSASPGSDYLWQTTPNSDNAQTTTISISWQKHFVNELHENGHFLAKVLDYTPRLSDNIDRVDYKRVDPIFDDNNGDRTKSAIQNLNSIIRFEIVHGTQSTVPPKGWQIVSPLKENATFQLSGVKISNGDSYQIWVKAYDVMGNTAVDSTLIYFDSSPPDVYTPTFVSNVNDGVYTFSSRVIVAAKDSHSGIGKVSFKFVENSTGAVAEQRDFIKQTEPNERCGTKPKECFCIPKGECFMIDTVLDIDNCWLKVPINKIKDEVHLLQITVYNMATLSSTVTYVIGMVDSLNGVRDYYSPSNITIHKTTDTSLSISWVQAPSCYERAGILIRLFTPDNTTKDFKVHKDATSFDLTGLSPTTSYWFELYTKYGSDTNFVMSGSPALLKFTTAEASKGFPPGGVAGLSVGFIFILVITVVVLVFLGRTGRLQPAKARVTQGIRTIRNTIRVRVSHARGGYDNRAYSTQLDDDIYYYGQLDLKGDQSAVISRNDISLETQIAEGKFAAIFLAKYNKGNEVQTVVAKVLKDDQKEENVMKMKAKINFYASKVGHHKNVLRFIGSVTDEVRGPIMVLEYCEKGVLKDFLVACRDNVTVDLEERLYRMTFGVCLGMDYLASKKVVHRRLAARNVFLNQLLEPKIAGFGPDPSGDEVDGEEKIPLKWMAPECMKTTRYANELSDVFSFGIVMWEIFSLGETPYPGFQSREVPSKLKQGYKMKKPEYCDDSFYKIMLKCWHFDPKKRSGFSDIKSQLTSLFHEGPSDDYYYRSNDF